MNYTIMRFAQVIVNIKYYSSMLTVLNCKKGRRLFSYPIIQILRSTISEIYLFKQA